MSKWTFLCIFLIFVLKKSCNFLADLIWNKLPPMFAYNIFLVLHVTGTLFRSPRSYIQIKGFDFTTVASISDMAYRWRLHSFSMKIFKCVHKPVDFRVFLHKICRFLCEWVGDAIASHNDLWYKHSFRMDCMRCHNLEIISQIVKPGQLGPWTTFTKLNNLQVL